VDGDPVTWGVCSNAPRPGGPHVIDEEYDPSNCVNCDASQPVSPAPAVDGDEAERLHGVVEQAWQRGDSTQDIARAVLAAGPWGVPEGHHVVADGEVVHGERLMEVLEPGWRQKGTGLVHDVVLRPVVEDA
jgi:hypothetical protein